MKSFVLIVLLSCAAWAAAQVTWFPDDIQIPENAMGGPLANVGGLRKLLGVPNSGKDGRSDLIRAIDSNDLGRVKELIATGTSLHDADGPNPLARSVVVGNLDVIRAVLDAGGESPERNICLSMATSQGDRKVIAEALKRGMSPLVPFLKPMRSEPMDLLTIARIFCSKPQDGGPPIYETFLPTYAAAALGEGPSHEFVAKAGITRLMAFAYRGDIAEVVKELDAHADIAAHDAAGWTALHWAAAGEGDRSDVIHTLLNRGAKLDALAKYKKGPFSTACVRANPQTVAALLPPDGAEPKNWVGQGLVRAVAYHHIDLVSLLSKRADIPPAAIELAAEWEVEAGGLDLLPLLIDRTPPLSVKALSGLLGRAIFAKNEDAVRLLISKGAPLTLQEPSTSHLLAAVSSSPAVFQVIFDETKQRGELRNLFEGGHLVDTVLMNLAMSGQLELCRQVLEAGANINATQNSATALTCAVDGGNIEIVKFLIERGAEVRPVPSAKTSALGIAAWKGSAEMVDLLINQGADPNGPGIYSATPLANAVSSGNAHAIRVLIQAGAKTGPPVERDDLIKLAIDNHKPQSLRALLESGVRPRTTGDRSKPFAEWPHLEQARYWLVPNALPENEEIVELLKKATTAPPDSR